MFFKFQQLYDKKCQNNSLHGLSVLADWWDFLADLRVWHRLCFLSGKRATSIINEELLTINF